MRACWRETFRAVRMISQDGSRLAAMSNGGILTVYDLRSNAALGSVRIPEGGWWRAEFVHDPERSRRGGGPAFFLLHVADGVGDAYARYRLHGDWDDRGPKGAIDVQEADTQINPDGSILAVATLHRPDGALVRVTQLFRVADTGGLITEAELVSAQYM